MASANAPPTNWLCESHDQQPISLLPPDTSGTDGLDDLDGVTIADLDEWDSPEEEEGPPVGQRQGSGGQTGGNASESTGSFFSDLLREGERGRGEEGRGGVHTSVVTYSLSCR